MRVLKTTAPFAAAIKSGLSMADMKDHSGSGTTVQIRWNLNAIANRDHIFMLKVGSEEVLIDLEELLTYTRLM